MCARVCIYVRINTHSHAHTHNDWWHFLRMIFSIFLEMVCVKIMSNRNTYLVHSIQFYFVYIKHIPFSRLTCLNKVWEVALLVLWKLELYYYCDSNDLILLHYITSYCLKLLNPIVLNGTFLVSIVVLNLTNNINISMSHIFVILFIDLWW